MKRLRTLILLSATSACAGQSATSGAPQGAPAGAAAGTAAAERRNPNIITRDELADPSIRSENVLQAVRSLRPQFLTLRGSISYSDQEAGKVHASINGIGVVALEELERITANSVLQIEFLSPAVAMQRFGGAAHQGPVIVVRLL